jgi:hypothetical protein
LSTRKISSKLTAIWVESAPTEVPWTRKELFEKGYFRIGEKIDKASSVAMSDS